MEPWAIRALARLQAAIFELENPDPNEEILGLCIVAVRSNANSELYSSLSAACGPRCSQHDIGQALQDLWHEHVQGKSVVVLCEGRAN
jgi:hypothetical protein